MLPQQVLDTIIDAVSRGRLSSHPDSCDRIRCRLEWSWGLEHGTLDEHVLQFADELADPQFTDIMMDDSLILVAHPDLVRKIYLLASNLPYNSRASRTRVQDLYEGRKTFEYLVLPVDPATAVAPRLLVSPVPPHFTISPSVEKLLKRWGYSWPDFDAGTDSIIELVESSHPTGATFLPDHDTFDWLRSATRWWATRSIPAGFFGEEDSEEEEASEDAQSSTMEWEVQTMSDEPCRRMLPHEFETAPVVKFRQPPVYTEEDDAISCDSHITGAEDPEQYHKASIARGDYETTPVWLSGIESWAKGVDGDEMLVNDGQTEDNSTEGPRVATSLDLTKPDYLSKPTLLSRHKIQVAP